MTLTSGAFVNKKRNKQTSHELQNNLGSSCISFCTPSRKSQFKTSQYDTSLPDKTLSAPAISNQVSRCRINFPHELTCQILTNQNIRIGRWAWSEKWKAIAFPACKSRLNFRVRSQFEINILKVLLMNTTYFIRLLKKLNLSLRSFEKYQLVSGYLQKNTRTQWVDTWARDTVRRNWSAETLFWQLSINQNMDVQYQVAGSQTS